MKGHSGLGGLLIGISASPDEADAKELAAKALLKAIKRDNPKAVVDAFSQLLECCDEDYPDTDTEDEEDD